MKITLASDLVARQRVEVVNQFPQTFKDKRFCGYTIVLHLNYKVQREK